MKRGTPEHPKTYELAAELGVPWYSAVGILETLWHFGARYALRGDIGRHSDRAIARACGFEEAEKLIEALVKTGWVDRSPVYRLVLHDWFDHCDDYVKKQLNRQGQSFAEVSGNVQTSPDKSRQNSPGDGMARHTSVSVLEVPNTEEGVWGGNQNFDAMFAELREIYRRAGAPVAPKHEQLAKQLILSLPEEARARVARRLPDYCKWALVTGKWPGPAKTKSLVNVLRDGDWDVELSERDLPPPPAPPRAETLIERKEREYRERHYGKGAP